jgi:D-glycero-D-manno-heptose 1,7-bisphosphate phosphatase
MRRRRRRRSFDEGEVGKEVSMTGSTPPRAVLFDRDGTLIRDVPYNGDPMRVEPMPTVAEGLALLRRRDIRTGVVTNQSGVARGLLTSGDVAAVNSRVDELLGPFDVWAVCEHGPHDGCACRKPLPGLVHRATRGLGLDARDVVVIGDIGADVAAGRAAGCRAVLVPTPLTRQEEVHAAAEVARTVVEAIELVLQVHAASGADR